jgi:L-seryl-tRNA(Ser) seleniumtransferase
LIEIGGSFRIPDIMAASDCQMIEVGTTNKTRLSDYENKITDQTALLFKAHKSNYVIKGFTEEVSAEDLAKLGKKHKFPVLYDLGSGLLRKINHPALEGEPDVKQALAAEPTWFV